MLVIFKAGEKCRKEMEMEMSKSQSNPSKEYRFFIYDPHCSEFTYFKNAEDRNEYSKQLITEYNSDGCGWDEEVENIVAGEITHISKQTNRIDRPPEEEIDENDIDQDGNYWDGDWDYRCNYSLAKLTEQES